MPYIKNLTGQPFVFPLTDGSSVRLLSNEEKNIKQSLVSGDITRAVSMGILSVTEKNERYKPKVKNHTETKSADSGI